MINDNLACSGDLLIFHSIDTPGKTETGVHVFLPIHWSVSDSFCHVLSSPSPAQYLCLKTAIHSLYQWLFVSNFADCSHSCLNVSHMYCLNVLPGVSGLFSNWQDITHRDLLLSGYFNPDIFSPVYKLSVQHNKPGTT